MKFIEANKQLLIGVAIAALALTYLIAKPFLSPSAEELQSMERVRYAELMAEETRKDQEAMEGSCPVDQQLKKLPSARIAICTNRVWAMGDGVAQ